MSIIVLNPAAEPKAKSNANRTKLLDVFNGKTIGLIDDGFGGNVPHTFKRLQEIIPEKFPGTKLKYWKKPFISQVTPPDIIKDIVNSVDAVIIGVCA